MASEHSKHGASKPHENVKIELLSILTEPDAPVHQPPKQAKHQTDLPSNVKSSTATPVTPQPNKTPPKLTADPQQTPASELQATSTQAVGADKPTLMESTATQCPASRTSSKDRTTESKPDPATDPPVTMSSRYNLRDRAPPSKPSPRKRRATAAARATVKRAW
jgi:hypothetical protein